MGRQPTCIKNYSAHIRGYTYRDIMDLLDKVDMKGKINVLKFKGSNFYPFPPPIANLLGKLLPSMSVSIFFLLEKKDYNGEFIKYLQKENLETNFYKGNIHENYSSW